MASGDLDVPKTLTRDELREIRRRRRDDKDVTRLLWYVSELRRIAVQAEKLTHALDGKHEVPAYIEERMVKPLRALLTREPAVRESRELQNEKLRRQPWDR